MGRSQQDIATTSERFIASTFQARSQLLLPDAQGKLLPLTHQPGLTPWDDAIARWSFDKGQPAGAGTDDAYARVCGEHAGYTRVDGKTAARRYSVAMTAVKMITGQLKNKKLMTMDTTSPTNVVTANRVMSMLSYCA